MKHILFLLLFLPVLAHAQFPASPNKIRLGNQTTADGLVVRTAASPSWTPTTVNNAWLAFDTVAVKLYYYDGGTWNEYTGGSVNIGNTDLTLTGNRRLNTGGYQLWIQDGTGAEVPYIFIGGDQVSFAASATTSVYLDSSEQRAAIIAGAVIDIDADSIRIIGTHPNDNNLNRLLAWDTITNRLKYVDKASIQSTDTNFAEDNLTFSGNRVHNLSTRTLTIADGGTYPTFQQSAATDGITLASSATDIIAQTPGLLQIENSDTIIITADRIRMNAADTRIQQIPNDNTLNRLAAIDGLTGRLYYIDKSSIVTTPPNTIYSDDDVIDGNRVVYIDGNNSLKFADSSDNVLFQIGVGATPYIAQAVTDGTSITNITSSAQAQEIGANGVEWVNSFTVDTSGFKIIGDGLTNDNALNRILVVDSTTNRIRYLDKGSISGGGGGVTGTGTTNTLAKWTSSTALGNSLFTDDGTNSVAGGTASFRLPNGTTAQRPGSPAAGMTRYNTTLGYSETYGAAAWLQSDFPAGTTGQTLRSDGTNWVASSFLVNTNTAIRINSATTSDPLNLKGRFNIQGASNTQIKIGNNSGGSTTGGAIVVLGNSAGTGMSSSGTAVVIGTEAGGAHFNADNTTIVGPYAMRYGTGAANTFVGAFSGRNITNSSTTYSNNVGVGYRALYSIATSSSIVAIGYDALYSMSSGTASVAIGYQAARLSTGNRNTSIGSDAHSKMTTGNDNVAIGASAGEWVTTDAQTVAIGYFAGRYMKGNNSMAIGYQANGVSAADTAFTSTFVLGTQARPTKSNQVTIGSSLFTEMNVAVSDSVIMPNTRITGALRVSDLTTDTPTLIVGADADGDIGAITVGSGLSLSSGTLSATGLSYNFAELTVSGGSTSATAGTPERPDNDTPGSASSTIVGGFTASGSTLDYTGSAGQGKLSAVISFTTSGGGDVLVSIYREGTQIASTEMREAVNAIYTTVALPTVTTSIATNDTFELRVEPVTGSNTITVHRQTLFVEKIY